VQLLAASEDFLDRNSWITGIAVPVLVGIAVLAIERYWHSRDRSAKTFDYCVISDLPILSHRPEDKDLKVTYLGDELENPRVVQVSFANSGSQIIRPSEILAPYILNLHDAFLVSAVVVRSSRPNLVNIEAICDSGEHGILLQLETLNAGDNFTLQLIVDSDGPINTELSGCVEEESRPPGWLTTERHKRLLATEIIASLAGAISALTLGVLYVAFERLIFGVTLIVVGLLVSAASTMAIVERRKRVKHGWPGALRN